MWFRAENGRANADFAQVLRECADYVAHVDDLMPRLQRPGCVMWLWRSPVFRLALCYRVSSDQTAAHIVVGVPGPEGLVAQWCKTMIGKLRAELDALGIAEWTANQSSAYESEHMAAFADGIDRFCHEFDGEETRGGQRRIRFRRRPERKRLDLRFDGPGRNRPARRKRGPK